MANIKTLYISDLDGTLLRANQQISDYSKIQLEKLIADGLNFTFATARSYQTATKALSGFGWQLPAIFHNGVFIMNNNSDILAAEYLDRKDLEEAMELILSQGVRPIVYSVIDGKEKFLFTEEGNHPFCEEFLSTRLNDPRRNPILNTDDLLKGQPYYITCIDEMERLTTIYEQIKDRFYTVFQKDMYSGKPWLEILPKRINKGKAALKLKEILGCDKIISFGDSLNDLELFKVSDEVYVPANANDEIKSKATAVIESNEEDGVVKWLLANKRRL